jgi:hypothetical protein
VAPQLKGTEAAHLQSALGSRGSRSANDAGAEAPFSMRTIMRHSPRGSSTTSATVAGNQDQSQTNTGSPGSM